MLLLVVVAHVGGMFAAAASAVLCLVPIPSTSRQAKTNAEAVLGRVVGAITGKKEGENIVSITTTIDLLQVFWEAEKARNTIS